MTDFNNPLNNVKIASPCPANWDAMNGNDKVRFCAECKLNVYNLSGMKKAEAENLLRNTEGRLCVRYFRRADGTVLTQNCPVGWRAVKRRVSNLAVAACTLVLSILGTFAFTADGKNEKLIGRLLPVLTTPTPAPPDIPLMGAIAMPSPTPKQTPKATPTPKGEYLMGDVAAPGSQEIGKMVVIDRKKS
jgi:hypothetical protein